MRWRVYGPSVSLALSEILTNPGVRALPLVGFVPVEIVILQQRETTPMVRLVVEEARRYVKESFPDWVCDEDAR